MSSLPPMSDIIGGIIEPILSLISIPPPAEDVVPNAEDID